MLCHTGGLLQLLLCKNILQGIMSLGSISHEGVIASFGTRLLASEALFPLAENGLLQLVEARLKAAALASANERRRIASLPPELAVVERARSQTEWKEFKRRQKAEAKRQKELFARMRELNGKPRELPPRFA